MDGRLLPVWTSLPTDNLYGSLTSPAKQDIVTPPESKSPELSGGFIHHYALLS